MSRPPRRRLDACDRLVKMLVIGDSGVGKSCLLLRFADKKFSPSFITTIGVDFKVKTVLVGDKVVRLQIWDTAGQERFRNITTAYFRGAGAIALVYDVTDRTSFENVSMWMRHVQDNVQEAVPIVLVGNKCDIETKVAVSPEEGRALAEKYSEFGVRLFLTSAKRDVNVTEMFTFVAEDVLRRDDAARRDAPPRRFVALSSRDAGAKCSCAVL